jgi:sugar/nucleoside kinase (ribokinase family)
MSILVVGSIALDTIETPLGKIADTPGGTAIYFSCTASLFSAVNMVAVVGTDFDFAQINFLKKRGVDFEGLKVEKGKTFRWGGKYHTDLNIRDTLFTELNVFENFDPEIPSSYKESDYLFLANIDPKLQLKVLHQVDSAKLVVLDTMNHWIANQRLSLEEVIPQCHIIIVNDEEARELTGEMHILSAARKILKMGPQYVIIKKGEHGSILLSHDACFTTVAFLLDKVVDPTGAGDSFAGGFIGYLATCKDLSFNNIKKAIIYGNVVASFTVEDFSFKRLVNLTLDEVNKRVALFKQITQWS